MVLRVHNRNHPFFRQRAFRRALLAPIDRVSLAHALRDVPEPTAGFDWGDSHDAVAVGRDPLYDPDPARHETADLIGWGQLPALRIGHHGFYPNRALLGECVRQLTLSSVPVEPAEEDYCADAIGSDLRL
jgi:hypothetical protein